jgi:hypothetical protein
VSLGAGRAGPGLRGKPRAAAAASGAAAAAAAVRGGRVSVQMCAAGAVDHDQNCPALISRSVDQIGTVALLPLEKRVCAAFAASA